MPKRHQQQDEGLGTFVIGALLGSALGAVAAFWFAPQSGEETRHNIQDRVTSISDDIEQVANTTRRRIEGDSIEDSLRAGKAEAHKFQESIRR